MHYRLLNSRAEVVLDSFTKTAGVEESKRQAQTDKTRNQKTKSKKRLFSPEESSRRIAW